MSLNRLRPALLGLSALAISAGAMGCAEERDPINRVQANALDKAFFVGDIGDHSDDPEFWTQATLIDVGYGASQSGLFTSTYTQGVARIKWQVTEDLLIGRLTYERIANSDGKGAGPAANDGQVVVAYPIMKHFDIRHAYNPSTGEELNVIEENMSDRPWYERQYMRVDWSKNINTDAYDFDTLSMLGAFGVSYEPLAYYVSDPNHPDAPFFDVEEGYFDVTNKAFASPGSVDLSHLGWGIDSIPACWLDNDIFGGSAPAGNCNATELTIRQAFRKVVDTDYEPADWDGRRFASYGGFYAERYGYARNFGMSDDQWHRFLTRYNIWERSHYYADPENMEGEIACYTPETLNYGEDAHEDSNPTDGTEDRCWAVTVALAVEAGDCAASQDPAECYAATNWKHGGSRCDTFKQKCTLPFRHRQSRPLTWHYTNDSNPDYFDGSEWATHDHDVGMRHAIQVAKYAECMVTAGATEAMADRQNRCITEWPVYRGQMDDHLEAKQLSKEVDDCRHGVTYPDAGAVNSEAREAFCQQVAVDVYTARSEGRAHPVTGFGIDPGVLALAQMPEQVVLCHSPVEHDDPTICAPADERLPEGMTARECQEARDNNGPQDVLDTCRAAHNVRIGDLRHHLVNVIQHPQTPSPWGIYTDAEDPLTGETFSAAINVWSHVNDLWSQLVMDRVRYIKGELATEEITEGEYVKNWAQAAEAANGGGLAPKLTATQRNKRIADFAGMTLRDLEEMQPLDPSIASKLRMQREEIRAVKASMDAPTAMAPIYHARRESLLGTPLEAELITPMMQQLAGTEGLPGGVAAEQASIFGQLNPTFRKEMKHMYEMALAKRGICVYNEAPAPMAITGLADVLERKFRGVCSSYDEAGTCLSFYGPFNTSGCTTPDDDSTCVTDSDPALEQARAEMMRTYLAQRAHYAVIVHEMGHSVGERHNFISSSDAYNYRPQYWQLRTNDGANATNYCTSYDETGACLGPRYFDPVTAHERDNMIWMWMHSSVMDYAGEYTQDFLGLAAYDMAAHRMFYGQNVAVFQDINYQMGTDRATGMLAKMDNFGGILGIQPQIGDQDIHYTAIQENFQVIYGCEPVNTAAYVPASWDNETQGAWDPVLDGFIVPNEAGTYTKCRQQLVDYVPWQSLRQPSEFETQAIFYNGGPAIDSANRVRVPYGFATDGWADLGNSSVYRHDNGADVYEIFNFLATQQEVHHIFDNYRRGRQSFSVRSAANRTLGRYNEKIRDGAKGLGLLRKWYQDIWAADGASFTALWGWASSNLFAENLLASGMVFDHFTMNFARPEAGPHYVGDVLGETILLSDEDSTLATAAVINIPNGATGFFGQITPGGKLVENRLADDQGEYDRDFTINAGSYYDKVYAPYLMTESLDNFISDSRNDFVNGRYRAVSLADLFPDGYRRWLGNNLTGDEFIKGARIAADSAGNPLVDFTSSPLWPIGYTSWWGDEVRSCFPAQGTWICDTFADQGSGSAFNPRSPDGVVPIDPQVGFEQHKFLIAQTLMYLPEDNQQEWLNQLLLYRLGVNLRPDNGPYIEFHDPDGTVWVANTFGTEEIFGKTVQKGVAARMLEYANELLLRAYEVTPICYDPVTDVADTCANMALPDTDALWYEPIIDPTTGTPAVKFDDGMVYVDEDGFFAGAPPDTCDGDATVPDQCSCDDNRACVRLRQYTQVLSYLSQFLAHGYHHGWPSMKGVYD